MLSISESTSPGARLEWAINGVQCPVLRAALAQLIGKYKFQPTLGFVLELNHVPHTHADSVARLEFLFGRKTKLTKTTQELTAGANFWLHRRAKNAEATFILLTMIAKVNADTRLEGTIFFGDRRGTIKQNSAA